MCHACHITDLNCYILLNYCKLYKFSEWMSPVRILYRVGYVLEDGSLARQHDHFTLVLMSQCRPNCKIITCNYYV